MKTRSRTKLPDTSASADTGASSLAVAPPETAARLVPLEPGFYAFSLVTETSWRDPVIGLAVPAVHVCAPAQADGAIEIVDSGGGAGRWLGGRRKMLFVTSRGGGGAVLVTAYLARDPDAPGIELDVRRLAAPAAAESSASVISPLPAATRLRLGGAAAAIDSRPISVDVVAHIRGRGDVRFVESPWAGRLGTGAWIEAFMLVSRNRAVAAAIEYKGLSASGAETPWIACGLPCGTVGRSTPLVGFAIRQKALPGGPQFDCEYSGYFQSGTTAGPVRNGAPCRSERDGDPLEGMQVTITARPRPATAAGGT